MKYERLKNVLILLLLTSTVGLTTGFDQHLHILVCHHGSHCTTESHGLQLSDEHASKGNDCPLCQFFACGYYQSLSCDSFNIAIRPAPALWAMPASIAMPAAATVLGKISRAPPAI